MKINDKKNLYVRIDLFSFFGRTRVHLKGFLQKSI